MTKTIFLSWLVLGSAQGGASGAEFRTDINPAAQYYQAFIVAPDFSQADRDYLFTNEWCGQKLPARFGALVARYDNEFRLVRQAARAAAPCDWGIDFSAGQRPCSLIWPEKNRSRKRRACERSGRCSRVARRRHGTIC